MECAVLVVRRAEIAQARVSFGAVPLYDGLGNAGLADPGLARDEHHATFASLGLLPTAHEEVHLLVPANERRGGCAQRLEPALGSAGAQYLPRGDALREPLKSNGPEVAVLEQAACQPPCTRCNHDGARFGQRLEPSGKVRRLSDHRLLLSRACANEIADHYQPGRNPHTHLQRRCGTSCEPWNRISK